MSTKLLEFVHNGGYLEPMTVQKYARKYAGSIVFFESGDYFVNYIPESGPLCATKKVPRHIWKHRQSTPRKRKAITHAVSRNMV